jgi:hypothetical protein
LYLEQDLDETVEIYDHFAIKNHVELETFNGADPWLISIDNNFPFAGCTSGNCDNIQDWQPQDTTNESSFTLSFPWGLGWSFNTNDDVDVDVSGSQASDYAHWSFTEARTWSSYLHNPERVTPGSAWISTGSYAAVDVSTIGYFDYELQTRSIQFDYDYRYDYPAPIT